MVGIHISKEPVYLVWFQSHLFTTFLPLCWAQQAIMVGVHLIKSFDRVAIMLEAELHELIWTQTKCPGEIVGIHNAIPILVLGLKHVLCHIWWHAHLFRTSHELLFGHFAITIFIPFFHCISGRAELLLDLVCHIVCFRLHGVFEGSSINLPCALRIKFLHHVLRSLFLHFLELTPIFFCITSCNSASETLPSPSLS